MNQILPTICEKCGFGREHVCERSVCPCGCHVPVIQHEVDPVVAAYVQATVQDLHEMAL